MSIQREAVIRAAISLLDEHGLEGLTMRRLAQSLSIQAPSLYWHFPNKRALIDGLADALIANVACEGENATEWEGAVRMIAQGMRSALRAHRDGARIFAGAYAASDNVLRVGEAIIGSIRAAGADDCVAVWSAFSVLYYVLGFVMEEQAMDEATERQEAAGYREALLRLPQHQYPHTWATREAILSQDYDRRFDVGLSLLIDGLRMRLQEVASTSAKVPVPPNGSTAKANSRRQPKALAPKS